MRRLIWKELREHYYLSLLVMLFLGAAHLAALYPLDNDRSDSNYFNGITITRDTYLLVTTFGSAAVGLLLGFIQILPELKPDRWASLVHRPAPRSHLYIGKALAGVLLYSLATVPPFLLCTWLAATPGHFPTPFVPELCLAGIADTFVGLVYYFAALLIALQRGGGWGLRALPLLAAVHVTVFATRTMHFADAMGAAALMLIALGFAACGAIMHRDSFGARRWPARLALLIVGFYGLCGIVDLVNVIRETHRTYDFTGGHYEITDEGRPLKLTYREGLVVSVQELDGSTPTNPNFKPDRVRNHTRYLNSCSNYIGDSHGVKSGWGQRPYRSAWRYLQASSPFSRSHPEQWFEIMKERTLIGVSIQDKVPIGRLDEHGFQPMNARLTPFPGDVTIESNGEHGYCLWSPDRVRFVDLPRHKVTEVSLPQPGPVFGIGTAWASTGSTSTHATAVALRTGLAFYDAKNGELLTLIPYHQDVDRWGEIAAGISPALDRFYVWYRPSTWIPYKTRQTLPAYFEETDAQGTVLQSYTLPPLPRTSASLPWFDIAVQDGQSPAFFFGTMLYQKIGAIFGSKTLASAFAGNFGDRAVFTKRTAIILLLGSLICAGVVLYWARRAQFDWPRAWRWAGLTLAFNIAGLILFRLVADWPRFVACGACQRRRPIHRETCPQCAQGWPAVEPTGTEIFDGADVPADKSVAAV